MAQAGEGGEVAGVLEAAVALACRGHARPARPRGPGARAPAGAGRQRGGGAQAGDLADLTEDAGPQPRRDPRPAGQERRLGAGERSGRDLPLQRGAAGRRPFGAAPPRPGPSRRRPPRGRRPPKARSRAGQEVLRSPRRRLVSRLGSARRSSSCPTSTSRLAPASGGGGSQTRRSGWARTTTARRAAAAVATVARWMVGPAASTAIAVWGRVPMAIPSKQGGGEIMARSVPSNEPQDRRGGPLAATGHASRGHVPLSRWRTTERGGGTTSRVTGDTGAQPGRPAGPVPQASPLRAPLRR
jgi:hypothetical protein